MKKIMNSHIDSPQASAQASAVEPKKLTIDKQKKLAKLSATALFSPTDAMAKVKARFWTKFQPGPLVGVENVSLSVVAQVTKSAALNRWWDDEGFRDWFLNRDEERERIKYLFNKGLDTIEHILDNPEANANAKANLIKMLAEMNGYLGKKPVEKFADTEINAMSEQQLMGYLERKGVKVVEEKVLDISSREDKEDL